MSAVPLTVPVYAVHGMDDDDVPASQSDSYAAAAKSAGAPVQLLKVPGRPLRADRSQGRRLP